MLNLRSWILFFCLLVFCSGSFAGLLCELVFKSNNPYDVAIGRRGEDLVLVESGGEYLRVPVTDSNRGQILYQGLTFTKDGQPRDLKEKHPVKFSNELYFWSMNKGVLPYYHWHWKSVLPLRSTWERLNPFQKKDPFGNPFNQGPIFRKLFPSYLKNIVSRGGRLHIRLEPSDERFLKEIHGLSEDRRLQTVREYMKSYLESPQMLEAPMTRLELLTVCSEPLLFEASTFYRSTEDHLPLPKTETHSLWVGSSR